MLWRPMMRRCILLHRVCIAVLATFDGQGSEAADVDEGDARDDFDGTEEIEVLGISGPDSEEILDELLNKFADRQAVALHRAVMQGNVAEIR